MSVSSDPFAAYRQKKQQTEDPFSAYRQKNEPMEEDRGAIGIEVPPVARQFNRLASEGVERVLSAPRSAGDFLEQLIPEKALKAGAEKIGLGKGAETLLEGVKKYSPHKLFPTKEGAHKVTKAIFGEQLEPKNKAERVSQEAFGDFVDLALPLPGKGAKFARPLLTSLGGTIAKEGVQALGGTEEQGNLAKLGIFGIGAFIHPNAAETYYNDQYRFAREARPERVKVYTPQLTTNLNQIERLLNKGSKSDSWKSKFFSRVDEVKKKITGNSIEVGELEDFSKSINKIIGELYQEKQVPKAGIKEARRMAGKMKNAIDKSLNDYAKVNPEWGTHYNAAQEAFGASQQSHKAAQWIGRNIKKLGLSHAGATALVTYLAGPASLAGGAAAAAVAYPTIKTAETITKIFKSPKLRKHFFDLFNGALRENVTASSRAAKELEKEID